VFVKKGICIGCLPGELSNEAKLHLAKNAGFEGVEINTFDDLDACRQLTGVARRLGIELHSVMASGHWTYPLSSRDESVRQQGLANIKQSVETALVCGAATVLVVPGVVQPDQPYTETYAIAQDSMRELAWYAGERNVRLGIENVWNRFLLTPMEMGRFLDELNSPHVGLYFDCGNILAYGYPQQWIRELGSRLFKVHVKDFDSSTRQWKYLLQGSVDWKAVRAALSEVGYDGYLTAEMSPYPTFADQMVRDTAAHLDRIIRGE
jgi:L-ribulose-5-phosphate 3-epimerase